MFPDPEIGCMVVMLDAAIPPQDRGPTCSQDSCVRWWLHFCLFAHGEPFGLDHQAGVAGGFLRGNDAQNGVLVIRTGALVSSLVLTPFPISRTLSLYWVLPATAALLCIVHPAVFHIFFHTHPFVSFVTCDHQVQHTSLTQNIMKPERKKGVGETPSIRVSFFHPLPSNLCGRDWLACFRGGKIKIQSGGDEHARRIKQKTFL